MEMDSWAERTTIPWQPHSKKRPRISRGGGRTHQDPIDKAAEERTREFLKEVATQWNLPVLTGNVVVSAHFYRASRQVVDLDNLLKHLLDCGNGLVWADDRQITRYDNIRLELDRESPRTEFWVYLDDQTTMLRGTDAP